MFNQNDISQITTKGISIKEVENQINNFKSGFPFLKLKRPAIINDGVLKYDVNDLQEYVAFYELHSQHNNIFKFVPASGAASRMFKDLYAFAEEEKTINISDLFSKYPSVEEFFSKIHLFSFYKQLKTLALNQSIDIDNCNETEKYQAVINLLLQKNGLDYGFLPKGLLAFHKYEETFRTAFEEHLVEGALYAKQNNNVVNIHFTVTPEHLNLFKDLYTSVEIEFSKRYNVTYSITYSIQEPSTDTIAVDMNNEPFREKDGSIVFRPAGHGALLHNLNKIQGPIIFIKNIDNVVPDYLKNETVVYKKLIGGVLLKNVKTINDFLTRIEKGESSDNFIKEISAFYLSQFHLKMNDNDKNIKQLTYLLNRPIRVCGMVKNQGEPGGGPFWVQSKNGESGLQVVESSQVDMKNDNEVSVFKNASHFNPVDLICYVNDYKGNKFDLSKYSDPETGFISIKSKDGKSLKAMELPGLWNGAMSNWNTIFVEVPLITFNPVKTVNDLLRKEHLQNS